MARSLDLNVISSQPLSYRDEAWERVFFQALIEGRVVLDESMPKAGPDGWPYIFARTSGAATEPALRLLDWLSTRGIGLVVNAQKEAPDYVFTYGMIWNFRERREFLTPRPKVAAGNVEIKDGEQLLVGEPSQAYLPDYVRQVLCEFLYEQGVKAPRVLMISRDGKEYDLGISLESLGLSNPDETKGVAEAIAWFLPQHYSILLISEKGLPPFKELKPTSTVQAE